MLSFSVDIVHKNLHRTFLIINNDRFSQASHFLRDLTIPRPGIHRQRATRKQKVRSWQNYEWHRGPTNNSFVEKFFATDNLLTLDIMSNEVVKIIYTRFTRFAKAQRVSCSSHNLLSRRRFTFSSQILQLEPHAYNFHLTESDLQFCITKSRILSSQCSFSPNKCYELIQILAQLNSAFYVSLWWRPGIIEALARS